MNKTTKSQIKKTFSIEMLTFIFAFLILLFSASKLFSIKYDLMYPESALIYKIDRVVQGKSVYKNYLKEPYLIAPYSPMVYYVPGFLVKFFSVKEDNVRSFTRKTIFLLLFITLAVSYIFSRCYKAQEMVEPQPKAATAPVFKKNLLKKEAFTLLKYRGEENDCLSQSILIGHGLFLSLPVMMQHSLVVRPDFLALLFSITGFWIYQVKPKGWAVTLLPVTILFILLSKQSYISLPLYIALDLMIKKKYRDLLFVSLISLMLTGFLFFLIQFHNPYFFFNIFGSLSAPTRLLNLQEIFIELSVLEKIVLMAAITIALNEVFQRRNSMFSYFFLISLGLNCFSMNRVGSATNYLIEPVYLSCLIISLSYGKVILRQRSLSLRFFVCLIIVCLSLLQFKNLPNSFAMQQSIAVKMQDHSLAKFKQYSPPYLVTDSWLSYTLKNPVVLDLFQLNEMILAGSWDGEELDQSIVNKKFKTIITLFPVEGFKNKHGDIVIDQYQDTRKIPHKTQLLILKNYMLVDSIDIWYIYEPA